MRYIAQEAVLLNFDFGNVHQGCQGSVLPAGVKNLDHTMTTDGGGKPLDPNLPGAGIFQESDFQRCMG